MANLVKPFTCALIDFDSTLYDTYRLTAALRERFLHAAVSEKDYKETFELSARGTDSRNFNYSFAHHINLLKERGYALPDSLHEELEACLTVPYPAPDAASFLQYVKSVADVVEILSAGDINFQMAKLRISGLLPLVDEVIIVPNSAEKLETVSKKLTTPDAKILFINDEVHQNNDVRATHPNVVVIGKKHPVRHNESLAGDVPYFETLTEIEILLKKQYV